VVLAFFSVGLNTPGSGTVKAPGNHSLDLDPGNECSRIAHWLRRVLATTLRRRGVVVGVSGGVDSAVTATLATQALGKERVLVLLMPERHSSPETLDLSRLVAERLGVRVVEEDITGVLEALGFYRRYEAAVHQVIPEFGSGWSSKLVTSGVAAGRPYPVFSVIARAPNGLEVRQRLPVEVYLEIVAATNFKQRTRKMFEYYHADRLNYAVAGTPNRLEYDQGFFVKNGDGAADLKPIAHLYKTQVYQLAEYLDVPEEIRKRPPTSDTYSMSQGQDEFFFGLPFEQMDLCLYGKNEGLEARVVAEAARLTPEQVQAVWADIDRKRSGTRYLHMAPLLLHTL